MNTNNNFSIESSNSYSRALYELSSENKCLDLIENQAVSLVKLIFESEDFNQLIKNPTIKYNHQINIINIISWYLFKPKDLDASLCPLTTDCKPALKISASKAESLKAKDIIPATKGPKLIPNTTGNP